MLPLKGGFLEEKLSREVRASNPSNQKLSKNTLKKSISMKVWNTDEPKFKTLVGESSVVIGSFVPVPARRKVKIPRRFVFHPQYCVGIIISGCLFCRVDDLVIKNRINCSIVLAFKHVNRNCLFEVLSVMICCFSNLAE